MLAHVLTRRNIMLTYVLTRFDHTEHALTWRNILLAHVLKRFEHTELNYSHTMFMHVQTSFEHTDIKLLEHYCNIYVLTYFNMTQKYACTCSNFTRTHWY